MLNILLPAVSPGSFGLQTLPEIFQDCMHVYAVLPLTSIFSSRTKIQWAFSPAYPSNRSWSLPTIWSHSTLPSRVQIGQRFHQLASTEPKLRVFQGQFKGHKIKTGVIWLKDLCQLCELSLQTSLFSHMKKVFKQQRGSAIGNQISPSLANIAVSCLEHQWHQQHKDALAKHSDELYIVRYVDNRHVLCGQHLADR